jgi:hypothetical protein
MKQAQTVLLAMVSVLLALNPADCFRPWLVDKDTLDCCTRGNCSPATKTNDRCCRTVSPESAQYLQAARQFSIQALDSMPATRAAEFRNPDSKTALHVTVIQRPPPLERASIALPLLI